MGGGGSTWEILLGGRMSEFSAGGGGDLGTPPSPQWGKPCFKETRKSSYQEDLVKCDSETENKIQGGT